MGWGFEIGPGWFALADTLAALLSADPLCRAEQVKSKFGSTSFRINSCLTSPLAINLATAMSRRVCEVTGHPARLHRYLPHWLATLAPMVRLPGRQGIPEAVPSVLDRAAPGFYVPPIGFSMDEMTALRADVLRSRPASQLAGTNSPTPCCSCFCAAQGSCASAGSWPMTTRSESSGTGIAQGSWSCRTWSLCCHAGSTRRRARWRDLASHAIVDMELQLTRSGGHPEALLLRCWDAPEFRSHYHWKAAMASRDAPPPFTCGFSPPLTRVAPLAVGLPIECDPVASRAVSECSPARRSDCRPRAIERPHPRSDGRSHRMAPHLLPIAR
jgi:hypothetical protein